MKKIAAACGLVFLTMMGALNPVSAEPSGPTQIAASGHSLASASLTPVQKVLKCLKDRYLSEDGGLITTAYSPSTGKTYKLECGNPNYGVIHIDSPTEDSHPIPQTTTGADQFIRCFKKIIAEGDHQPRASGTTGWVLYDGLQMVGGAYTQNNLLSVNTMFALGPQSNNWARCVQ